MKYLLILLLLSGCSVLRPYQPYPYSGLCMQFSDSAMRSDFRHDWREWDSTHNYRYYKKHKK